MLNSSLILIYKPKIKIYVIIQNVKLVKERLRFFDFYLANIIVN
jgi:hypothetical protein